MSYDKGSLGPLSIQMIGALFAAIALAAGAGACAYYTYDHVTQRVTGPQCVIGQLIALLGFDNTVLGRCGGSVDSMLRGWTTTPPEVVAALQPFGIGLLQDLQNAWDNTFFQYRTEAQSRDLMREIVALEIRRRGVALDDSTVVSAAEIAEVTA